jgi:hypothetical protein
LIVNEDLPAEVVTIFEQLLQLRYPIEKIRTVDNYPAADDERVRPSDRPQPVAQSLHRPDGRRTIPTTFKSNPSFRTNLRGYGESPSIGAAGAPASAEPFTSGQPIGAESKTS